jgi:hypothetical protein
MRRLIFSLVSIMVLSPSIRAEAPRIVKPVFVWSGVDSDQAEPSFVRSVSKRELQAVWDKHRAKAEKVQPCPEVDFAGHMVIAMFEGTMQYHPGIELVEIIEDVDCLRVHYYHRGSGQWVFSPPPNEGRAYVFLVIPASKKRVVFEEQWRARTSDPYSWKERMQIPAVGK